MNTQTTPQETESPWDFELIGFVDSFDGLLTIVSPLQVYDDWRRPDAQYAKVVEAAKGDDDGWRGTLEGGVAYRVSDDGVKTLWPVVLETHNGKPARLFIDLEVDGAAEYIECFGEDDLDDICNECHSEQSSSDIPTDNPLP